MTIPTLEDIEDSKKAMDDIQSFTYLAADSFVDANGVTRDTVNGRLYKMGYDIPILYTGGINFTVDDNTKTVVQSNVVYAPLTSALPFTTSGDFVNDDSARFFVIQGVTSDTFDAHVAEFEEYKIANDTKVNTNTSGITSLDVTTSSLSVSTSFLQANNTIQDEKITSLEEGQTGGFIVFQTYALLDAYTPANTTEERTSYKVTNDTDSNLNGYYSWVSGTTYTKDLDPTGIDVLTVRVSDLESTSMFQEGPLQVFNTIKSLSIFNGDNSKYYSVSAYFFDDIGTRFSFQVYESDDILGTGATVVCGITSAEQVYTNSVEFSLVEGSGSGITGTLIVEFGDTPSPFAYYGGDFAGSAIHHKALVTSPNEQVYKRNIADEQIEKTRASEGSLKLPFSNDMTNSYLRRLVKNVHVYGAKEGHEYIVYPSEIQWYRRTWVLRDITDGVDIAQARTTEVLDSGSPDYSTQPTHWKLFKDSLPTYYGTYAVIELDWSEALTGDVASTTSAEAGIHSDQIYTDYDIADYLDSDHYHEVIKVGSGENHTTLRAAIESLYWPGLTSCARAHYNHRILVHLVEAGTYDATDLYIPEWVEVKGLSWLDTKIVRENSNPNPIFQAHNSTKFSDCEILSESNQYCIHSDDFNRTSYDPEANGKDDWPISIRQSFKNMRLIGGTSQEAWLFGCGVSSGQTILFDNVQAYHEKVLDSGTSSSSFGFHNTGPTISVPSIALSKRSGKVIMRNCTSLDLGGQGVFLQSLGGQGTAKSSLVLENSSFHLVKQNVVSNEVVVELAKDRFEWCVSGVYSGAIWFNDPDCIVLKTSEGVSVTGSAAADIFGTVDTLGNGEKWIKDNTVKSLGERLGDCSTINKTLDIGGQIHTFTTDLTLVDNPTIIGEINVSITTNPVSESLISSSFFPDTGFSYRVNNLTISTLLQGTFVKRLPDGSIDICGTDDVIFGWLPTDILAGTVGRVVTSKNIASAYINNATADGEFGIDVNGELDYAVTPPVGVVRSGVINLYFNS